MLTNDETWPVIVSIDFGTEALRKREAQFSYTHCFLLGTTYSVR